MIDRDVRELAIKLIKKQIEMQGDGELVINNREYRYSDLIKKIERGDKIGKELALSFFSLFKEYEELISCLL